MILPVKIPKGPSVHHLIEEKGYAILVIEQRGPRMLIRAAPLIVPDEVVQCGHGSQCTVNLRSKSVSEGQRAVQNEEEGRILTAA